MYMKCGCEKCQTSPNHSSRNAKYIVIIQSFLFNAATVHSQSDGVAKPPQVTCYI